MFPAPSPFAFQPDEKVEQGFVRVLGQLEIQVRATADFHGPLSDSVHATRVLIKRLRALLWFARTVFPPTKWKRARARLRRAAHLLAAQRDLMVVRSILKKVAQKTSNSACRKTLARISRAPDDRQAVRQANEQSLREAVAILVATLQQMKRTAQLISRWPSPSHRLNRAFSVAKKSAKKALRGDDPAQFHDWRKKAKRLLYQLQLTQGRPGGAMRRLIKRVDRLQQNLGDYHDSVVAEERLRKSPPDEVPPPVVQHGVMLLEKRRQRLRKEARKIARQIA